MVSRCFRGFPAHGLRNAMVETGVHPPFGVKVARFEGVGYHPHLEYRSGTYKSEKLGPGCYDSERPKRIVSKVPRWEIQRDAEEFSKRLAYHGDHILQQRKWLSSINGPGWQDVPSTILLDGITFPKAALHPEPKRKAYAVPGPGTYGKNHVCYTRTEEKSKAKGFSFSTLSSFEQYSKAPRSLTTMKSYHLPPNLYKIKTSVQELLSKRISKRGPYDLFTGKRFPDPVVTKSSPPRQRIHLSDLSHPKNAFKGVFPRCGKESQMTSRLVLTHISLSRKNPNDPAPNHYDPYPTRPVTQAAAPFFSSSAMRPVFKSDFIAPPGRYNHEYRRNIIGDGMKSAFLSKCKRALPQPEKMSWFD